jgi:alpha-D-ribose 1-methylphosphonate 5-triphosphate diphosphatase
MNCAHGSFIIENGSLVLPDRIVEGGALVVENGLIASIGNSAGVVGKDVRRIDASGCLVIPGLIDLHSDALERELEPRPNAFFPTQMVLLEVDTKLAAVGITTMYHAISFAEGEIGTRSNKMAEALIREIKGLSNRLKINTKVHARYELTDAEAVPAVEKLIDEGKVDLFSLMDHTPGQGQFRELEHFHQYYGVVHHKTKDEIEELIERKVAAKDSVAPRLERLMRKCLSAGIPLASHDDDTREKLAWLREMGRFISEFPVTMEAAEAAREFGFPVCLGAPNALRGISLSRNLSAREAVSRGLCSILCSDYSPMALLQGAFTLYATGILGLADAVATVTINPAKAVHIDKQAGALEEEKDADLVIIKQHDDYAEVVKTFVQGREAFSTCLQSAAQQT